MGSHKRLLVASIAAATFIAVHAWDLAVYPLATDDEVLLNGASASPRSSQLARSPRWPV